MSTSSNKGLPRYAVTNTFSGQAGELSVAALLVRAGLRVAQPFWTNDFTDLLILQESLRWVLPIPVQVKSVQQATKDNPEVQIQGLKKKYVENNPALCLAIYSPAHDKIWFIPGQDNIRGVYKSWAEQGSSGAGRPRKGYDDISLEDNVSIRVNLSTQGDESFDSKWLVDRKSPKKLWNQLHDLADQLVTEWKKENYLVQGIVNLLQETPKDEELHEDSLETEDTAD